MGRIVQPGKIAASFRAQIREEVAAVGVPLTLAGFLCTDHGPSVTYADYTEKGCEKVGIRFDRRTVSKFDLEGAIRDANADPSVHGIFVYYPVFSVEQDNYIKDQVDPTKDVEGLNTVWLRKLYNNERQDDRGNKAILPCTPLAMLKLLDAVGEMGDGPAPFAGRTVVILNRSEVVGRPLAFMMANDGARVISFDVHGAIEIDAGRSRELAITREDALRQADIIVTGVPSDSFDRIRPDEIDEAAVCLNFSTYENFSAEARNKARVFIPRVGPMTVTMALRNTARLYTSYHGASQ